jgi:protein-S-isoprenylcysteine O-methyltransferase Ste14
MGFIINNLIKSLQYITTVYEIKNVWANDAHKVAVFISLLYSPFLLYIVLRLNKKSILNKLKMMDIVKYRLSYILYNVELVFLLIILSYILGSIGIGQIIIEPIYDAIIRTIGIILFINGILLYLILYSKQKTVLIQKKILYNEINIYKIIRNPEYTFLLMIALGVSLITLSAPGIILSIIIMIPFMLIRIKIIEKDILENDPEYSNYMVSIPKMLPSISFLIKRLIFKRSIVQKNK